MSGAIGEIARTRETVVCEADSRNGAQGYTPSQGKPLGASDAPAQLERSSSASNVKVRTCNLCHRSMPVGRGPGTWNQNFQKHVKSCTRKMATAHAPDPAASSATVAPSASRIEPEDSSAPGVGTRRGADIGDAEVEALKVELGPVSDRWAPEYLRAALHWLSMGELGDHKDVCAR